jgi:transcriptional regulator with XRE-family HTH domain
VHLGDLVRKYRKEQGLSVTQLARYSGVAEDAVRRIERGATAHPRIDTVQRLARGLNVDYTLLVPELEEDEMVIVRPKAEAPSTSGLASATEVEAPAATGHAREGGLDREDSLEILRRMENSIRRINEQCRANLQAINIDVSDRKATADQLIGLLSQVFWSHTGAKQYIDEDKIVAEASRAGSREERRAVRRVYAALNALYETFEDIGSVIDSFAEGPGREDAAIIYAEERFQRRRVG